jgi:chromosome segregation ATPase
MHKLTRQIVDHEEAAKYFNREKEALENANSKIKDNLNKLIADHEVLKTKSLELLKRTTHLENENEVLRKEKAQLVDNILELQKSHQDELASLRNTLESINEKLYVVGLDTDNKQTFAELESRHAEDKKAWTDKNRILQETCEQLQKDGQAMEEKIEEQHQIITAYQKLEHTFKEEQRKLRSLEKEFDALNENFNHLEQERDEALKQIKGLERDLSHSRDDHSRAKSEIHELHEIKSSLNKANHGLDTQIQDLEKTVIDLRERVKQAEQQNRSHERTVAQ